VYHAPHATIVGILKHTAEQVQLDGQSIGPSKYKAGAKLVWALGASVPGWVNISEQ
jgi:hypothetical protein